MPGGNINNIRSQVTASLPDKEKERSLQSAPTPVINFWIYIRIFDKYDNFLHLPKNVQIIFCMSK